MPHARQLPPFTLLHLTDLHFGAPDAQGHYWNSEATELELAAHDRRGFLGSLVRDLRKQKIKPDLVIVTGDLIDRAVETAVPMAIEFLLGLREKLDLSRNRFVIVPGNHDVAQAPEPAKRYALFDRMIREFYGTEHQAFDASTPAHLRVARFDFAESLGVEVIGFNSCEALDRAAKQEHGSIGTAQRDRAEELLDETEPLGLFRIAAMHHHLASPAGVIRNDYSVMTDAPLTLQWLAERKFHLVLHGHQHVDWHEERRIGDWCVAITAGASAGVASYGRKQWELRLGYQIILVESESQARRIRRVYDPQTREWTAAGNGTEHPLHFGPAAARRATAHAETAPTVPSIERSSGDPVDIYVMYAPEDIGLYKELEMHLAALEKAGMIRLQSHRDATGIGVEMDTSDPRIESARMFLVLVSPAFIRSAQFSSPELQRAMDRARNGKKQREPLLIPIYLRYCDWRNTELGKFQDLPRDGKPIAQGDHDQLFYEVVEELRPLVERLRNT